MKRDAHPGGVKRMRILCKAACQHFSKEHWQMWKELNVREADVDAVQLQRYVLDSVCTNGCLIMAITNLDKVLLSSTTINVWNFFFS